MTAPEQAEPTAEEYEIACHRIDAWRRNGYKTQRNVAAMSAPGRVSLIATNKHAIVARGSGPTLAAATVALAEGLPLPAPARVPVEPAIPAGHGREPSGAFETHRPARRGL